MYNSIVVSIFSKIWQLFVDSYNGSILQKVCSSIGRFFKYLCKGSEVKRVVFSENNILGNSIFYKVYKSLMNILDSIIKFFNNLFKKLTNGSLFGNIIRDNFADNERAISTLFVFTFFLGIGLVVFGFVYKSFSKTLGLASLILMLISIIVVYFEGSYKTIFENSIFGRFVKGLFEVDEEGGEHWW